MRTFPKIFGSSSRRETPRIHKFDAVVVYGHTGSSGSRPPGTMDQQVKGCFPDGLDGDGKCVDALDLIHIPSQEHMFLTEGYNGVVLLEKVAVADRLVTELIHIGAFKAGKTDFALGELPVRGLTAEHDGTVGQRAVCSAKSQVVKFCKAILETAGFTGNASFIDAGEDDVVEGLDADTVHIDILAWRLFPTELLGIAQADALFEHLTGHYGRGVFDFVIRTIVVGIRSSKAHWRREPDSNNLLIWPVGNVNVLSSQVDGRCKLAHLSGYLLTSLIRHILTENLQRLGMDAEEEPTALRVEKGTTGLHTGDNLSGSLLGFHYAVLIAVDDGLYAVYRQFFHGVELIVWQIY